MMVIVRRAGGEKTSVIDVSAFIIGNDFIIGMQLVHDELYRVIYFQVCRKSTSCCCET